MRVFVRVVCRMLACVCFVSDLLSGEGNRRAARARWGGLIYRREGCWMALSPMFGKPKAQNSIERRAILRDCKRRHRAILECLNVTMTCGQGENGMIQKRGEIS